MTVREVNYYTKTGKPTKNPKSAASTRVAVEYMGSTYWLDLEQLEEGVTNTRDNSSEWQVVRQSWGQERVVGTFSTKAEAEAERQAWEAQTLKDFKEGRIMYDVPDFVLVETKRQPWARVFG